MKNYENISLRDRNTFGIDAKARRLVEIVPGDEVPVLNKEVFILGAGSDVVLMGDYKGTIVSLVDREEVSVEDDTVTAWGGMRMDALIEWCIAHGLYGLENLSAIPGTVGAAVVQNVGAYGAEAKDMVVSVTAVDIHTGERKTYSNQECCFGYRDSCFKHGDTQMLVTHVSFQLRRKYVPNLSYKALEGLPHDTAQELREAIVALRWQKLPRPEEHGSAGSFFKNPVVNAGLYERLKSCYPDMPEAHPVAEGYKLSAGWLIDRAGWKGRTMGRVGVWPKQALVLYNTGGCTGDEVLRLAQSIADDVKLKFGVELKPEAIFI